VTFTLTVHDAFAIRRGKETTNTIAEASKTVNNFIPSKTCVGSTQQLMVMAKEADGINLKESHARNIVHSKSQNSVCVHLGQYLLQKNRTLILCL